MLKIKTFGVEMWYRIASLGGGGCLNQQRIITFVSQQLKLSSLTRRNLSTFKTFTKTSQNKNVKINLVRLKFSSDGKLLFPRNTFTRFSSSAKQPAVTKPLTDKSTVRRLLQLAKPERNRLILAIGLLLISSTITLIIPYGIGRVIDIIYTTSQQDIGDSLGSFCKLLLVVFVCGAVANFGRISIMQTSGNRIVKRLRESLFSSVVKQDIAFYDKNKTGGLINRLSVDTSMVGHTLTMNISDGLRSSAQALGAISWMVYTCPYLAGISLCAVLPLALVSRAYGRFVRNITTEVQDSLAKSSEVAEETISNIRTVHSFVKEGRETRTYNLRVNHILDLSFKEAIAKGLFWSMTALSGNVIIVMVFYYGGMMVSSGMITVGELSSFLLYATFVGISIGGVTSFYSEMMKGIGASQRLFELVDRKPLVSSIGGLTPSLPPTGHITYNNVSFAYQQRPDAPILRHFNLNLHAGSVTALVGASGSGKSTIAHLLLRFYDPCEGEVCLDGVSVADYNLHWLRNNISIVSQDPVLFSSSIAENIAYGISDHTPVTTQDIVGSAKKANAHQFIERFPEGYDTTVGERGVMLSGGQKQRIAIARAIIKNPRILLMDEATSALDAESEHLVQEALVRVMEARTVLVIAHRLSTIRRADQIAVLKGGCVVEVGGYDDLMKLDGGEFKKLVERQTLGVPGGVGGMSDNNPA